MDGVVLVFRTLMKGSVFSNLCLFRNRRYEQELASLLWKIDYTEILTHPTSPQQENKLFNCVDDTEHTVHKSQSCELHPIKKKQMAHQDENSKMSTNQVANSEGDLCTVQADKDSPTEASQVKASAEANETKWKDIFVAPSSSQPQVSMTEE